MSDVLSQNEIDELLNALSTGEVDVEDIEEDKVEKKIRKYDFSRPDKFAKDQLRTIEIIHDNYARLLNNFLSGYLRSYIEVEMLSTQSLIYNEFSNSISNPAILGIVNFSPLDGEIIYDISTDIAFTIIEKILGGSNENEVYNAKRTLTEIELVLIKRTLLKFVNLLAEPWGNIIEISPKLDTIETNSQFAQIVSPTESIALITFNLKIGEVEGLMNICIPHYVIEPILSKLSSKAWFAKGTRKKMTDEEKNQMEESVKKSAVDLRVKLGKSFITVRELLQLQVNDVVVLDERVDDKLKLYIQDDLKFLGKPGTKGKSIALKITDEVLEGDD